MIFNRPAIDHRGKELQEHGSLAFPCAAYRSYIRYFPWHWHDEIEMIYITNGPVYHTAGSQRFLLDSGDAVFINAAIPHAVIPANGSYYDESDILFHPRLLYGNTDSILWQKYFNPLFQCAALPGMALYHNIPWQAEAANYILNAHTVCMEQPVAYELMAREALSHACLLIWQNTQELLNISKPHPQIERVKMMLDYLHTNYMTEITMEQLAEQTHVCKRECQREFRAVVGSSPMQYLNEHRLTTAAHMLRQEITGITEIAIRCGFQSPSYFTKKFRERYRMSPSQYRIEPIQQMP